MIRFTVNYSYVFAQPTNWRISPCRLPADSYSVPSQLPSIYGDRFLNPYPEDAPCCCDRDSLNICSVTLQRVRWLRSVTLLKSVSYRTEEKYIQNFVCRLTMIKFLRSHTLIKLVRRNAVGH